MEARKGIPMRPYNRYCFHSSGVEEQTGMFAESGDDSVVSVTEEV